MTQPHEDWPRQLREMAGELEALAGLLQRSGRDEEGTSPSAGFDHEQVGRGLDEVTRRLSLLKRALSAAGGAGFPILVVDDDEVSRDLLVEFLGRFGPATGAASGQEALNLIARGIRGGRPYRVICLDLMMPEMDGHEVLRRLRSLEEVYSARVPAAVATTTALGDRDTVLKVRAAGSEAYFVKPIDLGKLGQWVEGLASAAVPSGG